MQDNKYLKSALELRQRNENRIATISRPDVSPEEQAEAVDLSRSTGIGVDVVRRNLADVRAAQPTKPISLGPAARRMAENPDLAPAIKDDTENLAWWERQAQGITQSFHVGKANVRMSEIGTDLMFGGNVDENRMRELRELQYFSKNLQDYDFSYVGGIPSAMAENAPIWAQIVTGAADETAVGAGIGMIAGFNPASTLAGAGIGFKVGSASEAFKLESGLAYLEYVDDGADPDAARGAAVLVGMVNAGLEAGSLNYLLRSIPGAEILTETLTREGVKKLMKIPTAWSAIQKFGKTVAGGMASEGFTEAAQEAYTTLGGILADKLTDGEVDMPTAAEVIARLADAGIKGSQGGAGFAAVTGGAQLAIDAANVRRANQRGQLFVEMGKAAQDSRTRERLPADFQKFLKDAQDEYGQISQVYAPPEVISQLFQDGGFDEFMPETAARLDEALESGDDSVAIPLEEFAAYIAPSEYYNELIPEFKFSRDELSIREAQEVKADVDAVYAEMANRIDSTELADDPVYADVKQQLLDAGRSEVVADNLARVQSAFFNTQAARTGGDALAMYRERNLNIRFQDMRAQKKEGVTRLNMMLDMIREGKRPSQKDIFGETFGEVVAKRGGIRDSRGELKARDLDRRVMESGKAMFGGLRLSREDGMTLNEVKSLAIEEGFLSETAIETMSDDDVLAYIDDELAGNPLYRTGAMDEGKAALAEDMDRLEETIFSLGYDLAEMTNDQVRDLLDDNTFLQDGSYSELDASTKELVDEALSDVDSPERKKQLLDEHKGTPWARQAISGAKAKVALKQLLKGVDPAFDNAFNAPGGAKLKSDILERGEAAVWSYLENNSIIGHPEKPVNAVNSSFINCEPSKDCAAYCYAAKGRAAMSNNVRKAELVTWAVENNPVKAAKLTSRQYGAMAESMAGKALRLFDKGDGSSKWIPYVNELNRLGVRTHIFSKNANFLREVPDGNIKLLSIDASNESLAENNPDLDVAYVYSGSEKDRSWLDANKEQIQMILPVVVGKKFVPKAQVDAVGKWSKPKMCPIDKGSITIKDGWNCTRCDKGGGVGCYHGQTSEKKRLSEIPLVDILQEPGEKKIFAELEALANELTGEARQELYSQLAALLSEVRSGIDREREGGAAESVQGSGSTKQYNQVDTRSDSSNIAHREGARAIQETYNQDPGDRARGFIRFNEKRDWFQITLTQNADLSTFLHESGHFFLEVTQRLAQEPGATDQMKRDVMIVREWLGAEGETLTTEQHEKFARGFERYLMEGKAPSMRLASVFERFKAWLKLVYRTFARLDVELTDDVREVFDRMLATDAEIAVAREETGMLPMFENNPDLAGMNEKTYREYMKLNDRVSREAEDQLEKQLLAEIMPEVKKEMAARKAAIREEVTAEIEALPEYRAADALHKGDRKLSRPALEAMYGRVPSQLNFMATAKGGVHPDQIAGEFGYRSGDEMIQAITSKPNKKEIIDKITSERLDKETPVVNASEQAIKALHDNPAALFIHMELRLLAKQNGIQTPQMGVIKQAARERIAEMPIMDIRPGDYRSAEKKASKESKKLALKGNLPAAMDAKRRQLMNHYLYSEASKAKAEASEIYTYLKRFEKRSVRERLGRTDYLDAIDALLDGVELRKVPLKTIRQRKSVAEFVATAQAREEAVLIPENLQGDTVKNFKQMSPGEFRALRDAVKNIDHLSRESNKLTIANEKRDHDEVISQLTELAYSNNGKKAAAKYQNPTKLEDARSWIATAHAHLVKMEFITRWIDGDTTGFAHETIFQPFVDAQAKKYDLLHAMNEELRSIFSGRDKTQVARHKSRYTFMGVNMRGDEIIAVALNLGNEGNREKLLEGYDWDADQLDAELSAWMTKADWDMVQSLWDSIDKLWPEIEAAHKRVSGLAPERVQASPVETPFGTYRGGYYPVVYDRNKTTKRSIDQRQKHEKKNSQSLFENNFMRPNVDKGFTQSRTSYSAPILLSLDVLPAHIHEVVHFVTHYEAVVQVDKITRDKDFLIAIEETMGREIAEQFRPWLQAIANDSNVAPDQSYIDGIMKHLRGGMAVVAMGYKLSTATMQAFGLFTTIDQIGIKHTMGGLKQMMTHPKKTWDLVNEQSGEMRHVLSTFDRDVRHTVDEMFGSTGVLTSIKQYAFHMMGYMQKSVNMVTWVGAYDQAIAAGLDHGRAVNRADAAVRQSQSAGGVKDLARVQRGDGTKQAFTMFYTYFSVLYNRLADTGRGVKQGNPAEIARLSWLVLLPVFFESMLRGKEPEDEDEWLQWFAVQSLLYGATTIPFVRDIVSGAMGDYGYTMTPVASFGRDVSRAVQGLAGDEEMTEAEFRALVNSLGITFKMPTGQALSLAEYIERFDEVDDPFRELIVGVEAE